MCRGGLIRSGAVAKIPGIGQVSRSRGGVIERNGERPFAPVDRRIGKANVDACGYLNVRRPGKGCIAPFVVRHFQRNGVLACCRVGDLR